MVIRSSFFLKSEKVTVQRILKTIEKEREKKKLFCDSRDQFLFEISTMEFVFWTRGRDIS